ncbi:MAG: 2-oxoglutarate dehydrogenase complex dihydrolipoyllysine-residue succinyltransferase [Gemmataceae bacterium]|jgi:2-oxoglutarate dehydrogenase E2 component (dihydrolipoamide succinyltransferase)|nr:2-oxoglutarate dehydrogenase complex dihydrolipoyllysine-residue succinyltransferase [Gemmataceae bacterium]
MPVAVSVPSFGESVSEVKLLKWLKPEGSYVNRDEPICEMESEKATENVTAPAAGTLKYVAAQGATLQIGAIVASIDDKAPPPKAAPTPPTTGSVASPARGNVTAETSSPATSEKILSPAAQRLAAEEKIDPATIIGTGRGGRIIKEDVQAAAQEQKATASNGSRAPSAPSAPSTAPTGSTATAAPSTTSSGTRSIRREPISPLRERIAKRLVESQQTTATLTTFNEADMSAVMAAREKYKDKFKEKHGVGLGFMSFFVKASIEALKAFPAVNARIDGTDVVYQNFYDIGVAVSTERGLMVPVIRDADALSFAGIEKKIVELALKARDGKLATSELQGGTFTITNGGIFGSMLSTPILNPPQTGILGMHSIQKRAVVVNDQIVIRPMMYLALSYDHRLIDGREAVQFLVRIKECIENPERILFEV